MIYCLTGKIVKKSLNAVVLSCGGVGYYTQCPASVAGALPGVGQETTLYTVMSVTENDVSLYGFATEEQQACFEMLTAVSGVGPKVGLAILSVMEPQRVALAISAGDHKAFKAASGVGPKLAQRIVLELKDKVAKGFVDGISLEDVAGASADSPASQGSAQAIAALAYGTATIPKVDKITGPGNAYVASAKRRVFGTVGIDMIAGPSEILVLADGSTPPEWVAMDLFSQAEHDELAQAVLLCPDAAYIDAVQREMQRLLNTLPRAAIIAQSLQGRGVMIRTRSMEEACELSNRIAPEHLEISSREPHRWEPLLRHAGAIFLGAYTSESLGDYCAGPNHVLPTSGTARFSSPLGVYDFQKRSSLIEVSEHGAQTLGRIASVLAHGEGLQAHARAAEMRLHPPAE